MIETLIIRPEAEDDIKETFEWYESKQNGLGNNFIDETEMLLQRIEKYPKFVSKSIRQITESPSTSFPICSVFYARRQYCSCIWCASPT